MKGQLVFAVLAALCLVGCNEDKTKTAPGAVNKVNHKKGDKMNIEGMNIEIIEEGTGAEIQNNQKAVMHYTGVLENGTKFDSSRDRNQPFQFTLGVGQVIRGWDLGVKGMKIGEKRKLTIPAELGYGERGAGGVIPGGATLIFDVELLEIR